MYIHLKNFEDKSCKHSKYVNYVNVHHKTRNFRNLFTNARDYVLRLR